MLFKTFCFVLLLFFLQGAFHIQPQRNYLEKEKKT